VYQCLLVATDATGRSDAVVDAATELARLSGGEVHLLHVREHQDVVGKGGGSFPLEEPDEVDPLLGAQLARVRAAGVAGSLVVERALLGQADRAITGAATARDADLIVLGSRGAGPVGALVMGSTVARVLHRAVVPVLVVR
jgi:nucleotide-binding universal stress UspA family protein